MRRPAEAVSQRVLAYEVKLAIDQAMSPRPQVRRVGVAKLQRLVRDNPIGIDSSHVQHNLGETRRVWLAAWRAAARAPLPGRTEASSAAS